MTLADLLYDEDGFIDPFIKQLIEKGAVAKEGGQNTPLQTGS